MKLYLSRHPGIKRILPLMICITMLLLATLGIHPGNAQALTLTTTENWAAVPASTINITENFGVPDSYSATGSLKCYTSYSSVYSKETSDTYSAPFFVGFASPSSITDTAISGTATVTWKNMGYDADGDAIDVTITLSNVTAASTTSGSATSSTCVLLKTTGNDLYIGACEHVGYTGYTVLRGATCNVAVKIVKHDTSTAAVGTFLFDAWDIDAYGTEYTNGVHYIEGYTLNSGFNGTVYVTSTNDLAISSSNTTYKADNSGSSDDTDPDHAFVAPASSSFSFTYEAPAASSKLLDLQLVSTITASTGSGGTITDIGDSIVFWKNNKSYTAAANTGYHIASLTVDDSTISAATGTSSYNYTFSSVVADHTIAVTYEANSYKIAFNGNGSTSGSMENQEMTYGVSDNLDANTFTKTGYTFTGWNTKTDGSGTSYANKQSVKNLTSTDGATVTLYAQWEANTYKIAFDANDDYLAQQNHNAIDASGSMDNQEMTYDVAENLNTNTFTRTNYTFTGWNTEEDGSGTSYADEQSVTNLTAADGGTVVLYAQWTIIAADFSFTKVSASNTSTPLEGAEFSLYHYLNAGSAPTSSASIIDTTNVSDSLWELIASDTSDENGIVTFENLQTGEYYRLVETKAPDEYALSSGQWNVTSSADSSSNIEWSITAVAGDASPLAFGTDEDGSLYVPNTKVSELPDTGSSWDTIIASGIGLALLVGAVFGTILHRRQVHR